MYENRPGAQQWYPQPAPRLVNRGIQGGTFKLDALAPTGGATGTHGGWKSVLKLESKCPDMPSAELNDHYRTIYVQRLDCGPLEATEGDDTLRLGVLLRFAFGIGNGRMKAYYDLVSNGILHVAITAESVEVDACTVQTFYPTDADLPTCDEDPVPLLAEAPPTITIGVIQNQALAMNDQQTPKRMIGLATESDASSRYVAVPPGAQSVRVIGDATVTAGQIFTQDATLPIPFPVNVEVPIVAGVWEIAVASSGGSKIAAVVFGLGV